MSRPVRVPPEPLEQLLRTWMRKQRTATLVCERPEAQALLRATGRGKPTSITPVPTGSGSRKVTLHRELLDHLPNQCPRDAQGLSQALLSHDLAISDQR